jgi:D-inositol-3-phosphate glycosyltransferase
MKIALVAEHAAVTPGPGAGLVDDQIRTRELARKLKAAGHQVTVYPVSDALSGVTAEASQLRQRWLKDRPDVVHAMRWTSGLTALAASRDLGLPVVQTFASLGVAEQRHKIIPATSAERIRLEPAIGRTANVVVAANSGVASDLARLGVPRRHIKVIPCGVDTDRFAPEGPVAKRNGRSRLLTVGELSKTQALNTLLHALTRVPETELIVAGGPARAKLSQDANYLELVALAGSLGIGDRVLFTGQVDEEDLPPLLRSADLYVNTTEYEPTGMISLDAMACGTPVVASAEGAPGDAVVDGTTGILVPPGRPTLLAHRIRQILTHPMLLEAYGVAAADRARSRYSWDRIARETVAAYESAAAA